MDDAASKLSQTIERDYPLLCRRIGTLVYRICGRLRRDEVENRVLEVVGEAVKRAIQAAESFDPGRSASAWIIGIALRVLLEQRRIRPHRTVMQSELGDEAWQHALDQLCSTNDADAATIRLDVRQAIMRLEEAQRRALELRYFRGLDGEELARELDAPTPGAARVRVARALQALRAQFRSATNEEET